MTKEDDFDYLFTMLDFAKGIAEHQGHARFSADLLREMLKSLNRLRNNDQVP